MGIDLKKLIANKYFIYNEFGMGGGLSECGDVPGKDSYIGYFPWLGVTTPYSPQTNPFTVPAVKQFVINYYKAALKVLKAGGGQFPVHQSYIWNCVSWDVQGIHTASALWNTDVDQGDWPVKNGFAIQEVIDMIKQHNAQVTGASRKVESAVDSAGAADTVAVQPDASQDAATEPTVAQPQLTQLDDNEPAETINTVATEPVTISLNIPGIGVSIHG
eukprot:GHRR01011652.1.p1 GENE.GHRR01011652.1~~GHRR01011652.1.p1  ORF type:complete len:217 (+),score=63.36 GHRR01011652.1:641-1291(+)